MLSEALLTVDHGLHQSTSDPPMPLFPTLRHVLVVRCVRMASGRCPRLAQGGHGLHWLLWPDQENLWCQVGSAICTPCGQCHLHHMGAMYVVCALVHEC